MVHSSNLALEGIAAELAAVLPPFDPLARRPDSTNRWILLALLLHVALLVIFWDTLIGVVIEEEETVTVRMVEEKPKLQRKVLAQRRIDTKVRRFKDIAQPEIQKVQPVPIRDQTQKIDVDPTQITIAPKQIQTQKVVTKTVSAFADVPQQVQPIQVDKASPTVRQISGAKPTAGPRKLEAAGPVVSPRAIDVQAPTATQGRISKDAVSGDVTGAKIASLESGTSDRFLKGEGTPGVMADKDCMEDKVCREYLQMIQERVYARWDVAGDTAPGVVRIRFQIDRGGSAHNVQLKFADDKLLGETCQVAFRHASPFPPPPKEIHYLVTKGILATFRHGDTQ